jgi:hypothetical protein
VGTRVAMRVPERRSVSAFMRAKCPPTVHQCGELDEEFAPPSSHTQPGFASGWRAEAAVATLLDVGALAADRRNHQCLELEEKFRAPSGTRNQTGTRSSSSWNLELDLPEARSLASGRAPPGPPEPAPWSACWCRAASLRLRAAYRAGRSCSKPAPATPG